MSTKGRSLNEFKSKHAPDDEVKYLREQVRELEMKLQKKGVEKGELHEAMMQLQNAVLAADPKPIVYKPSPHPTTPITHVVQLTDLHYGEKVSETETDGFGGFSPDIAHQRIEKLTQQLLDKTTVQRAGYNVPTLHILGTADYISGDIHTELQVTNAFPCPVQAVGCGYMLGGMLATLAPHFQKITADLLTLDNHGRITKKPQSAEGGLNNWGYVVATIVKEHTRNLANVEVNIHAKPAMLIAVGEKERYLCFHGHQIRGWAGIPYYGFDRRAALEAMKRMNVEGATFTKLVTGHFHHSIDGANWIMGGSLSGTNAYDHSSGRHAPPHQTSWFVHPKHGGFDFTRWWLT